ncbi:MAG: phosphoenolpyruvate--protein phosphotransferase [Treponema sp.]|nr:phosphoenolpyruvate--protein phosphotransferase [Treponema sp.]
MNTFLGIPAVEGIGQGKAYIIPDSVKRNIPHRTILLEDIESEWRKFQTATDCVHTQLENQLKNLPETEKDAKDIISAQILMLTDPVFTSEIHETLQKTLSNIEYVVHTKINEYTQKLKSTNNAYLAERANDVHTVFNNALDLMLGIKQFSIENVPEKSVVVSKELSPANAIILAKKKIAALVISECGVSSHVAIIARNYGIPSVVGIQNSVMKIANDDFVIVDGNSAQVIINPDSTTQEFYSEKINSINKRREELSLLRSTKAKTKDGIEFELFANIGSIEEAVQAFEFGADGIGLFRTEFLFMHTSSNGTSNLLNEDMQFNAYKQVLEIMQGKQVTIRTLDAGGDKLIHNSDIPFSEEKNPLMGLRAVRLSLAYPQIIRTQLRALYRASVYGNLRIMLPLITSIEQVKQCKYIAEEVKSELRAQHIPFNENVPLGIMIETAAAAILADCLSKECSFFSLGTNDLTQYTLGIDRENPAVSNLYNEFNLAVLRLISITIESAKANNIPISVCGEMAGNKNSVLILAGMGIRSLSMSGIFIPEIKELLSQFTT